MAGKNPFQATADVVKNMDWSSKPCHEPTIGYAACSELDYPASEGDGISEIVTLASILLESSNHLPEVSKLSKEDLLFSCTFKSLPQSGSNELIQEQEHYDRVDVLLREANLRRVAMNKDGNCVFSTCSFMLKHKTLTGEYSTFLESIGVHLTNDLVSLASTLRELAVNELTERQEYYQMFVSAEVDEREYIARVNDFTKSGVFSGLIGDLILPALSNVLKTQVYIFTSCHDCPFLHLQPNDKPLCQDPLHIVYICFGPGHYEATELNLAKVAQDDHTKQKKRKCVCGRTKGDAACMNKDCPCFTAKVSCGIPPVCWCRKCTNRYGTRESEILKKDFCRCGERAKEIPRVAPCSTTKCQCHRVGQECKVICKCKYCGNNKPEGEQKRARREVTERSISGKHSTKLERRRSEDFLTMNNFNTKPLGWCLSESILLNQIVEVKGFRRPYNFKAITSLFNRALTENPSFGSQKTEGQIKAKLALIHNMKHGK